MCDKVDLGFTPVKTQRGTHMCLIYSDEAERKEVVGRFMAAGGASGERIAYFADQMTKAEVLELFREYGLELDETAAESAVAEAAQTYCPEGHFDPDDMMSRLREFYLATSETDATGARVSGEMSWALRDIPGADRLIEYESRVTRILDDYPITAICQYDARRFSGDTLMDVMRVHPYMVVRNQVIKNPYYEPEEIFLQNRKRQA